MWVVAIGMFHIRNGKFKNIYILNNKPICICITLPFCKLSLMSNLIKDRFSGVLHSLCCDSTSCAASGSLCVHQWEWEGRRVVWNHCGDSCVIMDPQTIPGEQCTGLQCLCSCWIIDAVLLWPQRARRGALRKALEACPAVCCWHLGEELFWYQGDIAHCPFLSSHRGRFLWVSVPGGAVSLLGHW